MAKKTLNIIDSEGKVVRTYSEEDHGKDYKTFAKVFVTKRKDVYNEDLKISGEKGKAGGTETDLGALSEKELRVLAEKREVDVTKAKTKKAVIKALEKAEAETEDEDK